MMSDVSLIHVKGIRPSRAHRTRAVAFALALLLAITGCTSDPVPTSVGVPTMTAAGVDLPPKLSESWIAFAADGPSPAILLVQPGEPAHRIIGSDDDGLTRSCPAFAPGTARLAFGEATGDYETTWTDAALVLADVDAAGEASIVMRMALDGGTSMPCPIWSADGRWIAFVAESDPFGNSIRDAADVWLVDTQTGDSRRLTDLAATDIEWAPDGSELYIAGSDGISIHSLAEGGTRVLDGTGLTRMVAVSPDGRTLAVERRRINAAERYDLVLMNADGSDERVLVDDYTQMYGLGPVWSPDGNSVVFQRSCQTYTDPSGDEQTCYPQHEVVVVTTRDNDPRGPAGTQRVMATAQTGEGADSWQWFPTSVAWSPDGTMLLYGAAGQQDGGPDEGTGIDGVIAVPVTGTSPPLVMYETSDGTDGYHILAGNSFQSWGAP